MKIKRIFSAAMSLVFICAVALSAVSCTEIKAENLTADITAGAQNGKPIDGAFTEAELAFSLELFQKVAKGGKSNILISPVSVYLALSMAASGAGGETLSEMEAALGLSKEELNAYLCTYISSLPNEEKCKIQTANSFWFRNDGSINVNKPFLETLSGCYGAEAYAAPFDGSTVNDINKWVKNKTEGLIDSAVDEIPPQAVMYIINALVFDAEWQRVYERTEIESGKFTAINGEERTVKYMHGNESNFFAKDGAQGFLKYYKGGEYAFAAVMPEEGDVYSYAENLTVEKFKGYFEFAESDSTRYKEVYLPKFEYEYSLEMGEVLRALGINNAFEADADFSGIGETGTGLLYIDEVLHKTFISVDERGTKAGAVTSIQGGCGAMPPREELRFDKPFVYFIVDMNTKLPVFMGIAADIGK